MGVYIKGMEMPKNCGECIFEGFGGVENELSVCMLTGNNKPQLSPERMSACPFIEIQQHGRLIDADALLSLLDKCMFPSDMVTTSAVRMATNWIKDAPTIIEAEEDE